MKKSMKNLKMKIAVVTVNFNKSQSTIGLMKSLEQSDFKDIKFYVVDNNSDPKDLNNLETELFMSPMETKLIYNNKNEGWGMALNKAFVSIVKDGLPLTLVINNDARIQPNTISELIKTMENPMIGICGVKILHPDGSLATAGGRMDWFTRLTGITRENKTRHNAQETVLLNNDEFCDDCCWCIKSDILNYVQYPPYLFLYFEELWIIEGARKLGYHIAYNPRAIVYHS